MRVYAGGGDPVLQGTFMTVGAQSSLGVRAMRTNVFSLRIPLAFWKSLL